MTHRALSTLLGALALLLLAPAASAQVVLHGRVEDAARRTPLAGVRVLSGDSSAAVFTDSLGRFALPVQTQLAGPYEIRAERPGYAPQWFQLPDGAASRLSVLLLDPAPLELEGIEAVAESAVEEVLSDLRRRRNSYWGPVTVFDRRQIERRGRIGSAWDFIRQTAPALYDCWEALSGVCVRDRGVRSLREGPREIPVHICVDGRESWSAAIELGSLDIGAVALVEIFDHGRGGIRVYTPGYVVANAVRRRNISPPIVMGARLTC